MQSISLITPKEGIKSHQIFHAIHNFNQFHSICTAHNKSPVWFKVLFHFYCPGYKERMLVSFFSSPISPLKYSAVVLYSPCWAFFPPLPSEIYIYRQPFLKFPEERDKDFPKDLLRASSSWPRERFKTTTIVRLLLAPSLLFPYKICFCDTGHGDHSFP